MALKIGVHGELLEALAGKFSAEAVSRYLESYVRRPEYLTVVAAGGMRMCLTGEPVEAVTAAQQAHALQCLERQRLKKEGLLQPREKVTFTLDYRGRYELIKKVKASGLRLGKYAVANDLELQELQRNWNKAIDEQRERHARRTKLLLEFELHAMDEEQFAAHHGLNVLRLARDLEKARSYRLSEAG